ncbi:hypothetical protein DSM3645_21799 [Blastopirellula marina DSM 3645]|uniref:Uncharacterized protein n=1 Tax=Blastopirellula marina DSM 3645 TaxID=314230 RepID=A3ZUB5_9BACT|nr:hypothetical protein DSM3645_21799 [Blastopirellula marina DSM 3645]
MLKINAIAAAVNLLASIGDALPKKK